MTDRYIMECSQNAKAAATLNLNLESGLGDGGLLDANIEAARATPADPNVPVAWEETDVYWNPRGFFSVTPDAFAYSRPLYAAPK